jgi:TRAP-type mannitol/chloroaromatic compound transport system permease large subunit
MGLDPVWLGIMIAINLQTSFLTPPFGFALFYLRGVAPPEVTTSAMYRGVIPFVAIQLFVLIMLAVWPELATWLPNRIYG